MKSFQDVMLRMHLCKAGLTNKQVNVAELATKGLSNVEIAASLFLREKTVKFHLTNIYKKLNLKSRAQLIVLFISKAEIIRDEDLVLPRGRAA